jgi:inosine-uridine nucleoside N-ribohydrolase
MNGRGAERLVIDTDPGIGIPGADIDDGLAIALALRSPEVEVEAVTVVAGNVPLEQGVECVLALLEVAGATEVPVHRGAAEPLLQDSQPWRGWLDRRHDDQAAQRLWRGVGMPAPRRSASPLGAAQALIDLVERNPGEVTILAIGPLTNIATAMLLDAGWADKVKRLVIMGGAFDSPNVLQELNAAYDPEAMHVVLASRVPMLVVPLDVTLRTFFRLADVARLDEAETPLGRYLGHTVRPWVEWLDERFGRQGCALHDPLALAALIDPTIVRTRMASASIELCGTLTRGRTVSWLADDDDALRPHLQLPSWRPIEIAYDFDNARLMAMLLDRLAPPAGA